MMNEINPEIFRERRIKFLSKMQDNSIAVFVSAGLCGRSGHTCFDFRQDSDFYYLTGFDEPDSACVLIKSGTCNFVLFVKPYDAQREIWEGKCAGVQCAVSEFKADAAYSIDQLESILPSYLEKSKIMYFSFGKNPEFDKKMIKMMNFLRAKERAGLCAPNFLIDPREILHEMRIKKTKEELQMIRKAADIGSEAQIEAMKATEPGMYEYEIEAVVEYVYRIMGASGPAFATIVASGPNSVTLHHEKNDRLIKKREIVTLDAGAEYNFYASDITRSFPSDKKFTKEQAEIYEIVLESQLEAIKKIKPGNTLMDIHGKTVEVLCRGMIKLKLFEKSLEELISSKEYQKYYMHQTSHWLGVDVHDVGKYKIEGDYRKLEEGMVFTVEPGLYINSFASGNAEKYRNIGVRIEDDVLVTKNGCEVLTKNTPKTIKAIETTMTKSRKYTKRTKA